MKLRDLGDVFSALADGNRLRAVAALEGQELCVCELQDLLGLAPSTASKHLTILRQARLVEGRKQGKWMHYRLVDREATPAAREALKVVVEALRDDPTVREDAATARRLVAERPACGRPCGSAVTGKAIGRRSARRAASRS